MPTLEMPTYIVDKKPVFIGFNKLQSLYQQFANHLGYKITASVERKHDYGKGGFSEEVTQLLKDDHVLLSSKKHFSWHTYSDDSEDHGGQAIQETTLHQDEYVARKIFDNS